MRVDKWLWTARLLKSRSIASEAAGGGRVHVNGVVAKPSREVKPGDVVRVSAGPIQHTVIVRGLAERRVSPGMVAELYEETPESIAAREQRREMHRLAGPVTLPGGRPTKRARRRYDGGRSGA